MMVHNVIGDVLCPGVDVDAWKAQNRAPLFPGKQNKWVLARANDDGLTVADITTSLYEAFEYWFDASVGIIAASEDRAKIGEADSVRVVSIGEFPQMAAGTIIARKESLSSMPIITGKRVVYVEVTFDYRGTNSNMAWPCFTSIWDGKIKGSCPNSSDWALQYVFQPVKGVEPERTDGDVLTDFGGGISDFGGKAADALKTPFYVLMGVLGILGVAYILGKVKK